MPTICPECGAILPDGDTCQGIFESFLALEFTDPAYGQVHMLTVACFMIQHGRYSDEALAWIERQLRGYLEEGLSIEEQRRRAAQGVGQGTRTWKITRQADATPLPKIAWEMTLAEVAAGYQDAASYRRLVEDWARKTLRQMNGMRRGV
jgi:hypothetical protein